VIGVIASVGVANITLIEDRIARGLFGFAQTDIKTFYTKMPVMI